MTAVYTRNRVLMVYTVRRLMENLRPSICLLHRQLCIGDQPTRLHLLIPLIMILGGMDLPPHCYVYLTPYLTCCSSHCALLMLDPAPHHHQCQCHVWSRRISRALLFYDAALPLNMDPGDRFSNKPSWGCTHGSSHFIKFCMQSIWGSQCLNQDTQRCQLDSSDRVCCHPAIHS